MAEITNLAELDYPLGMPLAWIFTPDGEVILDSRGRPLSRHITDFEYLYDEEEDDQCNIEFQFDDMAQFNLPYVDNDVVILVQWGFVTPSGKFIKSPKRKVAIRDIESSYSTKGLTLKIECSDLVAYLKGYKTQAVRKFKNPNAKIAIGAINKQEDNLLDWAREIADGKFKATITDDRTALHFDLQGGVTVADYDPKTNKYRAVARDVTAVPRKFFNQFAVGKVIKGKSKALHNGIQDLLDSMVAANGGNFIMDTTDDELAIRARNFEQDIFKHFLFKGEPRDLISFKSSTDTRKTSEDISTSSGVDPYSKEVNSTKVGFADTSEDKTQDEKKPPKKKPLNQKQWEFYRSWVRTIEPEEIKADKIAEIAEKGETIEEVRAREKAERERLKQINEESFNKALEEYADNFIELYTKNIKENIDDQSAPPDLVYIKEVAENNRELGEYAKADNYQYPLERVTIPVQEVMCLPAFQSKLKGKLTDQKEELVEKLNLIGKAVEKMQRKHEATATVMGDPSLMKARVYGFFGLSNKDTGRWYATSVSHKISVGGGYICEMELIRKPRTISSVALNYKAKRTLLTEREQIELQEYIRKSQSDSFDEDDIIDTYVPDNEVEGIEKRIETLNAWE